MKSIKNVIFIIFVLFLSFFIGIQTVNADDTISCSDSCKGNYYDSAFSKCITCCSRFNEKKIGSKFSQEKFNNDYGLDCDSFINAVTSGNDKKSADTSVDKCKEQCANNKSANYSSCANACDAVADNKTDSTTTTTTTTKTTKNKKTNNTSNITSCDALLGDKKNTESVAWLVQKLLDYLKILGPVLVVILSSVDFATAIVSGNDDTMKKAQKKLITRLIAAVLLFLIPTVVQILLDVFGMTSCTIY